MPGKRILTRTIVAACFSPVKPGAIRPMRSGVARTPNETRIVTRTVRSVPTALAVRFASSSRPSASRRE